MTSDLLSEPEGHRALTGAEEEMIAELRASDEDHEAGRSMTIDEYKARAMARRQARDGVKDNQ